MALTPQSIFDECVTIAEKAGLQLLYEPENKQGSRYCAYNGTDIFYCSDSPEDVALWISLWLESQCLQRRKAFK